MRLTYDRMSDAATVYLVDDVGAGGAPQSVMCDLEIPEGAVILLLSADQRLVGIEVLGASRILPTNLLAKAEPPAPPI